MESIIWIIPLFLSLTLLRFQCSGLGFECSQFEEIMVYIIIIILFVISIFLFLSNYNKLYFDSNHLILANKLNKKIIIDINKFPQIYIKRETYIFFNPNYNYDSSERKKYILHIKQDNNEIAINIQSIGSKKVQLLLNNIKTTSMQNIPSSQLNSFLSEKEKTIDTKTNDSSKFLSKLIICTLLIVLFYYLSTITSRDISHILGGLCAFGFVFDIFVLIELIDNRKK